MNRCQCIAEPTGEELFSNSMNRDEGASNWATMSVTSCYTLASETGSVSIQLAQCWFHGLAIFNAKILIYFSNKSNFINFIKQHSETVMVWNYQNADCSLKSKFIVLLMIIFGTLSFHTRSQPWWRAQIRGWNVSKQVHGYWQWKS